MSVYYKVYDTFNYHDENGTLIGHHEDYGGCYISDQNTLVVLVKPGSTALINELNSLVDDDAPLEYRECRWTMNEAEAHLAKLAPMLPVEKIEDMYYTSERNTFMLSVNFNHLKEFEKILRKYARSEGLNELPFVLNPQFNSREEYDMYIAMRNVDLTPLIIINSTSAAVLLLAAILRRYKSRH